MKSEKKLVDYTFGEMFKISKELALRYSRSSNEKELENFIKKYDGQLHLLGSLVEAATFFLLDVQKQKDKIMGD